mmetsp:Transcript_106456/g.189264  ORF Transcript_106456/g.189264 Transcript_106456/m.189264 type:complete len:268 (-) Transcript_106456:268-1071(-)
MLQQHRRLAVLNSCVLHQREVHWLHHPNILATKHIDVICFTFPHVGRLLLSSAACSHTTFLMRVVEPQRECIAQGESVSFDVHGDSAAVEHEVEASASLGAVDFIFLFAGYCGEIRHPVKIPSICKLDTFQGHLFMENHGFALCPMREERIDMKPRADGTILEFNSAGCGLLLRRELWLYPDVLLRPKVLQLDYISVAEWALLHTCKDFEVVFFFLPDSFFKVVKLRLHDAGISFAGLCQMLLPFLQILRCPVAKLVHDNKEEVSEI